MLRRSAQSVLPRLGGSLAGSLQSPSLKDGLSCIGQSLENVSGGDSQRINEYNSSFRLRFSRCTSTYWCFPSYVKPTDVRGTVEFCRK